MSGRFTWHTLMTSDSAAASSFYSRLFNWKIDTMNMGEAGTYDFFANAEVPFGGVMQTDPAHGIPTHWSSYLHLSQSVDDAAAATVAAGGAILQPAFDLPDVGRMSVVTDPQGAVFILFKGSSEQMPLPTSGYITVPGGVSWMELMTKDTAAAASFYGDLAGWTSFDADMGTGPYTVMQDGETMLAGIMSLPEGMTHPAWMIYFEIIQETMEEALAEVKRLGGQVGMGPMEIPTVGTIAAVTDPTGAWFNLMKSAQ